MHGNELIEHVRELAHDLHVRVWVSITGPGPWGMAVEPEPGEDQPLVWLGTTPDTPSAYIVALHELGHHADPDAWTGYRLDREAYAWSWALDHSRIDPDLDIWRTVYASLASYAADRRYRQTEAFSAQLDNARAAIAQGEQQGMAEAVIVKADLARRGAGNAHLCRRALSTDSPSLKQTARTTSHMYLEVVPIRATRLCTPTQPGDLYDINPISTNRWCLFGMPPCRRGRRRQAGVALSYPGACAYCHDRVERVPHPTKTMRGREAHFSLPPYPPRRTQIMDPRVEQLFDVKHAAHVAAAEYGLDPGTAEDVVSEAYLIYAEKLAAGQVVNRPGPYIEGIIRNLTRNVYKDRDRTFPHPSPLELLEKRGVYAW